MINTLSGYIDTPTHTSSREFSFSENQKRSIHRAAMENEKPTPDTPTQEPSSSKPTSAPSNASKSNKRKTGEEPKLKTTQITENSPDPVSCTDIVAYDDSPLEPESGEKKATIDDLYNHAIANSAAMERAEDFQANLDPNYPSFRKSMVRSNVTHGFWLHLPMQFCKLHMPKNDTPFSLETENGSEYKVNYISQRTALSGGWKAFCDANQLLEGDVLVFHMVGPLRFKVYVVRSNGLPNFDAEAKPLNSVPLAIDFDATAEAESSEKGSKSAKRAKRARRLPARLQDGIPSSSVFPPNSTNGHVEVPQLGREPENLAINAEEGDETVGSAGNFEEVTSIDNFTIITNGVAIDSDISEHHRTLYYELCRSQNCYLHDRLLKSINCKLAAEIITQTVNIAEAIRASSLTTSLPDYEIWDKTLKGFELLGMNVLCLRSRLQRLISLSMEVEQSIEARRLREASQDKAHAEEEIRILELKVLTLKETIGKLDSEVESLKSKAERHGLVFMEEVNAPW